MDIKILRRKFSILLPALNERGRRLAAAAEAQVLGHGGAILVSRASGLSVRTIYRGIEELESDREPLDPDHVRRSGGGRMESVQKDHTLLNDLQALVKPGTGGDPCSPLRWTCKSLRNLESALKAMGHSVSSWLVGKLLRDAGYSLQGNMKAKEGKRHPDRNAQFEHINRTVRERQRNGEPVISVDAKKKELIGDFKNSGRQWRPAGVPERVRVHDFVIPRKGKAAPYGVYDLSRDAGWVSVGIDHDTAAFAVHSIRRWWQTMGRPRYPKAKMLLITADAGGSNSARSRLWKWELQRLADDTGLHISVCHFPPGTSKWNKIEHRLFSFISQNWRGHPLTSLAVIVSLIAATRTKEGLRVRCEIDRGSYPKGLKITDEQMDTVALKPATFQGDWNYLISPATAKGHLTRKKR